MMREVEQLLAGFDAVQTPRRARERADEIVRTIVALYGDGLERVLSIVHAELGDRSAPFFERLCEDKFVESLLCLHGLHPIALEDRVDAALESVRPYITSHQGNMEVARIDGDVVYLRLEGSCDGCPASAATLKLAVERAILERAPEIREVRAEEPLVAAGVA
jgi:Fe-S cluster biogenesis protein NfuA